MEKKRAPYWYEKRGLRHVTGFLSLEQKTQLKRLAKEKDKSLAKYVTRLLEKHLKENFK